MTKLTIEQRELIRKKYEEGSLANRQLVNNFASSLGIHRNAISGVISSCKNKNKKLWTKQDLEYLKQNMNKQPIKYISKYLDRSIKTVFNRITIEGWKRTANFSYLAKIKNGQRISTKTEFKKGNVPHNAGRSFEEIYGVKRAKYIKQRMGNRHYPPVWNKGLTKETDKRVKQYGKGCSKTKSTQEWKETKGQAIVKHMRENNPAKYVRNPSKPQLEVYNTFSKIFDFTQVFCNYKIKKNNGGYYYLDVAIPLFKLDIEYDGVFWHRIRYNTETEEKIRDAYLRSIGWNIIRIQGRA